MLKVNVDKISLPEFAKKYGLCKRACNENEVMYRTYFEHCDRFPIEMIVRENGNVYFENTPVIKELDLLFDMISNGDVIKEGTK